MIESFEITAYENLVNAIVQQAAKDIRHNNEHCEDAREFLKSDWCSFLTNADGSLILEEIDNELKLKEVV